MVMARGKIAFKVDVEEESLEAFREVLDKHKIGYSLACEQLFRWFTAQDSMLRSLLLGQIEEKYVGQVLKLVMASLNAKPKKANGGAAGREPHPDRDWPR